MTRRSLFQLIGTAPAALALAEAAPAAVLPAPAPLMAVDSLDAYRLAGFAMMLLGLMYPGDAISKTDYVFIRQFVVKGMSPEALARQIAPYYFANSAVFGNYLPTRAEMEADANRLDAKMALAAKGIFA